MFGLIAATGARIWVDNKVDFSQRRNLVTAAVDADDRRRRPRAEVGGFTLGGIGTATFGAIILYQVWRDTPETP